MIPAVETVGFFVAISVVLRFSSWAEGWLAARAELIPARTTEATPARTGDYQILRQTRHGSNTGAGGAA